MTDCLFCNIVTNRAPSEVVYRDEFVTAFRDINPVAPTHILLVPNRHIATMNDLTQEDEGLIGHMISLAPKIAAQEGINETGYRLIINTGPHGGQVIFHLHLHLIGGQHMRYPMG